jgi:hypothetical protein
MRIVALGALVAGLVGACSVPHAEPGAREGGDAGTAECADRDGDGYGEGCPWGADCDDRDRAVHAGCLRCALPDEGCPCTGEAAPVECFLDKTEADDGTIMCHEGTRYCRDGAWSGCESVRTYPRPQLDQSAIIDPDAGPVRCNDCAVHCFRISDNLDPVDGGLSDAGTDVDWAAGGGLTLGYVDAGVAPDSGVVFPPEFPDCSPGVGLDPDCDGIPNPYDPYPDAAPFATANPTIFLDIAPGETGRGTIDLGFFINSADVYFLVDQSNSMANERDQLKADLTTGDFIQDADFDCSDYDFDFAPNNELKAQGIVGAIRCMIRDTNFGVGMFREIPFYPYVNENQETDHVAFANHHDVSGDVSSVLAAINQLTTIGNRDWPEASMLALHSVLTGDGMYFGTNRRGVPPREDCPEQTWGYPCFRDGAIPVVVMFTDAQFHNGPDSNDFAYSAGNLDITAASGDRYYTVPNDNEMFEQLADLGDVTSSYKTFTGDTSAMRSDLPAGIFSCLPGSDGNDAVFQFRLTQQRNVKIESTGSRFDTVLGLFTGVPGSPTHTPASDGSNETAAIAYDFGQVYDSYLRMTGSTTGMAADYQWSDVTCDAASAAPDAVFKFNLSQDARVAIDASGSSYDTVLALYRPAPALPPTYTAIANSNEDHGSAYAVGELYDQIKAYSGNTAGMASNYSAAQVGCNADAGANDAVYGFSLSTPTRVRISTEGSAYDTVLGLFDSSANPIGQAMVAPSNEVQTSAYHAGTLNGRIFALTGSTASMTADIGRTPIGCNSNDYARDAVFKFHLDAPADVQIDTIGTVWDSVLSLHDEVIDANTTYTQATNANDTYASAVDLGTLNAREVRMLGATTDTSAIDADYGSGHVSCGLSSTFSPDAAYRFHLDTATLVRIDMAGSSFDTALSLHQAAPAESSAPVPSNGNEDQATALSVGAINANAVVRTGSTASMAHHYNVGCTSDAAARDAVFSFSLTGQTEVQIDTEGTGFDTVLGLYPASIQAEPAAVDVGISNRTVALARNLGTLDGSWHRFTGTTTGAGAEWADRDCNSDEDADDSYFRFTLTSTRNVTIDSAGSSFDTVLSLYRQSGSSWNDVACEHDNNDDEVITRDLSAGTYLVVVKGDRANDEGPYALTIKDTSVGNRIACDDNGGSVGTSSKITTTLGAGTYHVVVSAGASAASGAYTLRIRDNSWWNDFGEIECDDDDGPGTTSLIERQLAAGDYWFIVKGRNYAAQGNYQLRVTDVNPPPETIPAITCDDDSGGGGAARIAANDLPAGDYWVVIKGDGDNDAGNYTLNIRDLDATASGSIIQCDDDGGESGASVIERNLDPGNYQLIVKGDAASDEGAYRLSIRDVTRHPYNRLACDDDAGADTSSYIEQNLTAGDYYVALKGNEPADSGPYVLSVRDVTHRPLSSQHCDDNGSTHGTSMIQQTLNPGTYFVALKGKTSNEKGVYQLSVGTGTTHASSYDAPTWAETLAAVQSTQAHVIPILSCHDDPAHGDDDGDCEQAREQATVLANSSHALGENLQPLVFDIDGDGAGLSRTVVNAVAELTNYLAMDVKVQVLFDPDENPGFIVTVRAIDQAGDGCSGLLGIEHQNCVPGASPRFTIDFENPLGAPVPPHPTDAGHGYHFRAELIGDDQFVIDSVPIYIIPEDVIPNMGPPPPEHLEQGQYWQDSAAPGCTGNNAPDWRDLSWNADVYPNTTITFSACTAQTTTALAACTPHPIATVTGAGSCASSADCSVGYCDTDIGVCQIARAGACSDSSQCAVNAFCDPDVGLCTYTSQPVYIGSALGADNFQSFIRMVIGLGVEASFEEAPVLHGWEMTYHCHNVL